MCTSQTTEDFFLFEMTVENVKANKSNLQQAVVLKVRTANKYLPILIGSVEANAISLMVLEQYLPRPMTHDLIDSMIRDLSGRLPGSW